MLIFMYILSTWKNTDLAKYSPSFLRATRNPRIRQKKDAANKRKKGGC